VVHSEWKPAFAQFSWFVPLPPASDNGLAKESGADALQVNCCFGETSGITSQNGLARNGVTGQQRGPERPELLRRPGMVPIVPQEVSHQGLSVPPVNTFTDTAPTNAAAFYWIEVQ
jgi:hypothetical protein